MISDDAHISKVYDKVCTAIQVGQNNSVLLARILTRLEMLEDRMSGQAASSDDGSNTSASADTTGQFSDVSLCGSMYTSEQDLPNMAKMIPCNSPDDVDALEEAMKNSACREWMVRMSIHECIWNHNACVCL